MNSDKSNNTNEEDQETESQTNPINQNRNDRINSD